MGTQEPLSDIPCGRTYRGLRLSWDHLGGHVCFPGDRSPPSSSPGHSQFSTALYLAPVSRSSAEEAPFVCSAPGFSLLVPALSCRVGKAQQRPSRDGGQGLIPTSCSFVPQFPPLRALGEGPAAPPPLRGPDGASTGHWAGLSPAGSGAAPAEAAPAEATPAAAALPRGGESGTPVLPDSLSPPILSWMGVPCPHNPHPKPPASPRAWGPGVIGGTRLSVGGSYCGSHPWLLTLGSQPSSTGGSDPRGGALPSLKAPGSTCITLFSPSLPFSSLLNFPRGTDKWGWVYSPAPQL